MIRDGLFGKLDSGEGDDTYCSGIQTGKQSIRLTRKSFVDVVDAERKTVHAQGAG